jgi:hypothetical protein
MHHIHTGNSTPTLADVTVTHPIPSQLSNITLPMTLPLHFAKHREEKKIRKYGSRSNQINHQFIPMVLETFGAYGPRFSNYLKSIANQINQSISINQKAQLIRYWRMKISACLQRANARLIINKAHRVRSRLRQAPAPVNAIRNLDWEIR